MPLKTAAEWLGDLPVPERDREDAEKWIRAVQADAYRWAAEQQREAIALTFRAWWSDRRASAARVWRAPVLLRDGWPTETECGDVIRNAKLVTLPKEGK